MLQKMGIALVLGALTAVIFFALKQEPKEPVMFTQSKSEPNANPNSGREVATLAGGCFWCLEAVFEQLKGVEKVESGYAGGSDPNPNYKRVCEGNTGHAEVVQVTFDPSIISFRELLEVFFVIHDPTTLNRQGGDVGTQYRSAVFFHSPEQEQTTRVVIADLTKEGIFNSAIVTEVEPFTKFFKAEDYHQGYFRANPNQPYCAAVVGPKVAKFRKKFLDKLKKE